MTPREPAVLAGRATLGRRDAAGPRAVWPKGRDFMPTLELVDLLVAHNPGY
jgi:hypothetical protein